MVICLERGADLHMAQLMPLPLTVSCFSKIQIVFPFLVTAHPSSSGKRAAKRVCVCVVEHESEKLDAKQSPTEAHAARLSPSPSPYLLLYFDAAGRFKQDAELVTGENVLVETVEKAHEVTSTLFIDNCSVADDGDVRVTVENKAGTASHTAKLTVLGKSHSSSILGRITPLLPPPLPFCSSPFSFSRFLRFLYPHPTVPPVCSYFLPLYICPFLFLAVSFPLSSIQ